MMSPEATVTLEPEPVWPLRKVALELPPLEPEETKDNVELESKTLNQEPLKKTSGVSDSSLNKQMPIKKLFELAFTGKPTLIILFAVPADVAVIFTEP
jgi:hypothetical protein